MRRLLIATLAVSALSGAAFAQSTPAADPSAPGNPAIAAKHKGTAEMATAGHNSFTEGQARKRITKAGYTGVSKLTKDAQGLWQGTAMKSGASVNVALDYKGDVVVR
jgi:opacity protein-like surface antigen